MRPTVKTLVPALALSLTLAACGSSSSGGSTSSSSPATPAPSSTGASSGAVKTATNAKLGATVLVDAQGMTLYHLSGEGNGKFICDSAECEQHWPPLPAAAKSASVGGLATVKRPNGMEQLTYDGEPLYTFKGDTAPGQVNGQGVVDGGRWSAVRTGASSASAAGGTGGGEGGSGGTGASGSSGGSSGGYAY
jgi:predicted lipoprotein with Yx(FWY)xxD motif